MPPCRLQARADLPGDAEFFFRWGLPMVLVGSVATCALLVLPGVLA
ncbi:hypothetical protein ACWDKQ_11765 [Saccharopolyspora sp. NPDC000995]